MKSYTDIEQSKKLAEILPIESADMYYSMDIDLMEHESVPTIKEDDHFALLFLSDVPCWSLAALLSALPYPSLHKTFLGWRCDSYNKEGTTCKIGNDKDNPIDACVAMIEKLHNL